MSRWHAAGRISCSGRRWDFTWRFKIIWHTFLQMQTGGTARKKARTARFAAITASNEFRPYHDGSAAAGKERAQRQDGQPHMGGDAGGNAQADALRPDLLYARLGGPDETASAGASFRGGYGDRRAALGRRNAVRERRLEHVFRRRARAGSGAGCESAPERSASWPLWRIRIPWC